MRASIGSLFAIVPFRLPPRCSCPGQRRRAWMMTTPPPAILRHWMAGLLAAFSPRTQGRALTLVAGAILAPGRRTVASALRVMGLAEAPTFTSYHRALNRNGWSRRELARRPLCLLVRRLVPEGPIIVGLDDTLERRRGAKIKAKGIYRDPVRSSHSHFVKASGLRWLSLMLLAPVPYASRVWALPFLTVLAPSARYHQERGRRHKTLLDWGRQTLLQLRRWLPGRRIVAVTDTSFAALELLGAVRGRVDVITRLRLDANLFAPAPPRRPGQTGRPRRKGERVPKLEQRLARADTPWRRVGVPDWYGGGEREGDIVSGGRGWDPARPPGAPRSRGPPAGPGPAGGACRSAGSWCAIPGASSSRRPSCAPTRRSIRRRSCGGSSCAGASRSPSRKDAGTSASRRSGSGRTRRSRAPRRRCWRSSRWSPSGPLSPSRAPPAHPGGRAGTPSRNSPSAMPSPPCASASGGRRV